MRTTLMSADGRSIFIARDSELRERMGRAGRDHVVPRYRVERLIDDVDALYRKLLRKKRIS